MSINSCIIVNYPLLLTKVWINTLPPPPHTHTDNVNWEQHSEKIFVKFANRAENSIYMAGAYEMKAKIDIVTGFLGSGKTTLINSMLEHYLDKEKKILILQYESGENQILEKFKMNRSVIVEQVEKGGHLQAAVLAKLLHLHSPSRIIIEYNGTHELEHLLVILEKKPLSKRAYPDKIITVVNAGHFAPFSQNPGNIFLEPITKSDLLLLTYPEGYDRKTLSQVRKKIKNLNKDALFFEASFSNIPDNTLLLKGMFPEGKESLPLSLDNIISFALFYGVLLICGLIITLRFMDFNLGQAYLNKALTFTTIFVSILLQAFPFILIGVLISGLIQVFVSEDFIVRFFSKNLLLGMSIALVVGVFFPVCDCVIIPVMRRLVQKGVPLSAAVTFMLAAPIVDPVVITSTLYAFPENPKIAVWRVILGVSIAVVVGLFFVFIPYKGKVLQEGPALTSCHCGYCGQSPAEQGNTLWAKLQETFRHAGREFFLVGQYLVIAAVFSTFIQTSFSLQSVAFLSENPVISLLIMEASAFVLSICSTSDAFIARNFSIHFTTGPVLAFMVFGAMLDIKNLLLLLGSFRKYFVLNLILLIILVSFIFLLLASLLFF